MDYTLTLTMIGTAAAIIGSNIALISWLRSGMKSFESEVRGWKDEIHKEMKDFHGHLCSTEEKIKKYR